MKRKIKIILVMVTSVNGKSTKGEDSPNMWASEEDQHHFKSIFNKHSLFVMGRKTYEAAQSYMSLEEGKLRVIVTSNPEDFKKDEIIGQLEFTNDNPKKIAQKFEDLGYTTMILLGGSSLNTAFFKALCVDELWVTVEPIIIGNGKGLVENDDMDIRLTLKNSEKLGDLGTLLLRYNVEKT